VKRTPIISLTVNAIKSDIEKCLKAGLDASCKPTNPLHLYEAIDHFLKAQN
jgi:CheY-like chemotaxis protein